MPSDNGSSAMERFLNDVGRYPMMTPEEEIRLGRVIKKAMALKQLGRELTNEERLIAKRGERAKRRFVEANLRLVVYIAKRYVARRPLAMDLLDLVQEGTIGLIRAAEMFDPERGYKFSTYSFWWCRQAMSRALMTQERLIRRPATVAELASKLSKAVHAESQRLGRAPTTAELASYLNVKEEELLLLKERGGATVSLDSLVVDTESKTLIDLMVDPNSADTEQNDSDLDLLLRLPQLHYWLSQLKDNEREFIEKRYGINGYTPHTLTEIAQGHQISRERVRQVISSALRKIKHKVATSGLALNADRTSAGADATATALSPSRPSKHGSSAPQTPLASPCLPLAAIEAPAPQCEPSLCA